MRFLLAALVACRVAPPEPVRQVDDDHDGWLLDEDCDDGDAGVNPGAVETCDGVDQDCDGAIDEQAADAAWWSADADGDGYGDASEGEAACEAPAGAVTGDDDCDDRDAAIHPGAVEACDGLDDDCDGEIDEGC